ncbi:uncharacterized protein LOC128237212 isoform X1 [Mya arenaria]|uniref:uncharacterized protein LOC128237212 isoform X1 n=1 Tax=Mya arenaria TaxID=6604 RepID=UPI0022DFE02D|nr:uncharacterized protein LOC128237212 isoform X1 [Mya arenaria]
MYRMDESAFLSLKCKKFERQILCELNRCNNQLDIHEILKIANEKLAIIPTQHVRRLRNTYRSEGINRTCQFVLELYKLLPFEHFLDVFRFLEQNRFVIGINQVYCCSSLIRTVQNVPMQHGFQILHFYLELKKKVDNGYFVNTRDRLLDLRQQKRALINARPGDSDLAFNQYVCVTALLIQVEDDCALREDYLTEMQSLTPQGVDTRFSNVVFFGYKAFISALKRNVHDSHVNLTQMSVVSDQCANGFVRAAANMFSHYVFRHNYINETQDHDSESLCKALSHFELALECVSDGCLGSELRYGQRLVLLNMVQSYLKITNDFFIDTSEQLDARSRAMAEKFLSIVHREYFQDIECRRSMIYYLCMARVNERENCELALLYVEMARQRCTLGSYCRANMENIDNYYKYIMCKAMPTPALFDVV